MIDVRTDFVETVTLFRDALCVTLWVIIHLPCVKRIIRISPHDKTIQSYLLTLMIVT